VLAYLRDALASRSRRAPSGIGWATKRHGGIRDGRMNGRAAQQAADTTSDPSLFPMRARMHSPRYHFLVEFFLEDSSYQL